MPEKIKLAETELSAEERRLGNFVDLIGEGRGSEALAKALAETERRVQVLREELEGLRLSGDKVFQAPPIEWIESRLEELTGLLKRRTGESAMVLRRFLGQIRMEPTKGDIGRPYYVAQTSIDALAVLEPSNAKNRRTAVRILRVGGGGGNRHCGTAARGERGRIAKRAGLRERADGP